MKLPTTGFGDNETMALSIPATTQAVLDALERGRPPTVDYEVADRLSGLHRAEGLSFPFGRTSGPDLATRSGSGYSVRAWLQSDATPVANHVSRGCASPKLVAKMEIPE